MAGMARAVTIRIAALAACALLGCLSATQGAEEPAPPASEPKPPARPVVRRIGPQLFEVGAVRLDAKKRTIRCKGHVAMSEGGPLELLACVPTGKAYESIFTLDMRPMDLQVALLLLGLNPGRNPAYKYPPDTLEPDRKPGDEVLLHVEWTPKPKPKPADAPTEDGDKPAAPPPPPVRVPAEQFLYNRQTRQPLKEARWVFLGSTFVDGRFGADLEGSLITTYHDPLGILELAAPMVGENQYENMDYSVNEKLCPPVGTPVELVIELPHKDEADKKPPLEKEEKEEDVHAQDNS